MRALRSVLLGVLAVGVLCAQGLTGSSASADTDDRGQVRIVPSLLVYGQTRGELMEQLWTYWYQRRIGDPNPECFSIGRNDKVLIGQHDSTCTIKLGQPVQEFWSNTCDTKSPPPWYAVTEAAQRRCARKGLNQDTDYVKVAVDALPATTISAPRFEVISGQFGFVSPVNNEFGYPPGPGTASADSWVAMVYLPVGHHVLRVLVKRAGHEEFTITKAVDVVR